MSGLKVNFSVNNQLATPSIHAAPFAQRPAAGQPGRVFIDTDSPSTGIYRDTGTTWIQIAGTGGGGGDLQTVTDAGNTTTNDVAIGTSSTPSAPLDVHGAGVVAILQGTGTNDSFLQFNKSGNGKFKIGNVHNSGNDYFSVYNLQENSDAILVNISTNNVAIGGGTVSPSYRLDINGSLRSTGSAYLSTSGNVIGLGGTNTIANNNLTINQGATNKGIVITGPGTVFGSDTTGGTRIYNYANIVNNRQIVIGRTDDGLGTNIQVTGRSSAAIFGQNSSSGSIIDTELGGFVGSNLNLVVKGSTGNILIGTTGTDAGQKLQINGSIKFDNIGILSNVAGNAMLSANNTDPLQANLRTNGSNISLTTSASGEGVLGYYSNIATLKWYQDTIGYKTYEPDTAFTIAPSSNSYRSLVIRNNGSSATANLIEFREGASTVMGGMDSKGDLFLGTSSPNASAILHLSSTTKGFLPPVMTGAQAEAIASPAAGLLVYADNGNGTTITTVGWWGYTSAGWVKLN